MDDTALIKLTMRGPPVVATGNADAWAAYRQTFQTWHQDCARERILGIVINLSPRRYAGGQFHLRHAITKQTVATVACELGDCHLFRSTAGWSTDPPASLCRGSSSLW